MFANHNTTDIYKKKIEKGNFRENITRKFWLALIQFSDNSTLPTSAKKLLFFPGSIFYLTSVILRPSIFQVFIQQESS